MNEAVRLFRNRDVARLWVARFISHFGDWILLIALPVWVYQLTDSATILGLLVAIETLPIIFLGPVAGVFVDRWDRRRVIVAGHLVRGVNVLLLFLVTAPREMPLVFLVGLIEAAATVFTSSARRAWLPNLVTEGELVTANSLFSVASMVPRLVGPAVGAALLAWAGPRLAFAGDSATFFMAALAVIGIRAPGTPPESVEEQLDTGVQGVYRDLIAGVRLIQESRILTAVLATWALLTFAAGPVVSLLVVFVQEALHGSPASYGLLESLLGLGMLVGFVVAGSFLASWPPVRLFKGGLVVFAPLFLLFANAPNVYWAGVILPVTGMTMAAIMVADETILQRETTDAFRGRVMTTNEAIVTAVGLLSAAAAGVLMDQVGVRPIFNAAGAVCVVAAFLGLALLRGSGASDVDLGKVSAK